MTQIKKEDIMSNELSEAIVNLLKLSAEILICRKILEKHNESQFYKDAISLISSRM